MGSYNDISVKLISKKDQIKAGCIDYDEIIDVIERAFISFRDGKVILPDKTSQIFDEESQSRINCMPSTLMEDGVCGVKWVSVFPENPYRFDAENVSGAIILSETEKGYPFAFMDATLITALRTAGIGAIGAKYLARKNASIYATIGAGTQAKAHFRYIKHVIPSIRECRISSRTDDSVRRFIDEMSAEYPDVEFVACGPDYRAAASGADVIVTAVSCQKPLLKAEYVKEGAYYCHVGGWEDDYDVPLKADKIVCDDWNALKHRGSPTIARMYELGRLRDEDIYAGIAEIIAGEKPGRESEKEITYFNAIGLSFVDIALAYSFYKKTVAAGFGQEWSMWGD